MMKIGSWFWLLWCTWLGGEELVIGFREDDKWKIETLVQLELNALHYIPFTNSFNANKMKISS